jgi:hypothetical protein
MRLKWDHTSFACMYVSMRVRLMTACKLHYKIKKKKTKNLVKLLCDNSGDMIRASLGACGSVSRLTGCEPLVLVGETEDIAPPPYEQVIVCGTGWETTN